MATDDSGEGTDGDPLPATGAEPAPESETGTDRDTVGSEDNPDAETEADPEPEEERPATVGEYGWEDFKREHHSDQSGSSNDGFDPEPYLGFAPEAIDGRLGSGGSAAERLSELRSERTVRVDPDLDEDAFFSNDDGTTTVVTRYDLEKAVPQEKKSHFREVDRYWVNKPYAFVIIFHSEKENEKKYYLIEPHLTTVESDLREFLVGKLKTAIKYSDDEIVIQGGPDARAGVIEDETHRLLDRYGLYTDGARPDSGGLTESIRELIGLGTEASSESESESGPREILGISARPEPAVLEADSERLTEHQIEKLLYLLRRDFVGFERIDGIKHDINVEDISCDGYDSPVFVYHSEYEQIISNVHHGTDELDEFVVKLAQRSGKGISKRSPQVDATLPDGSRAQLTLGREVSDHGTNYTIRQFKDVPFTPVDLINWKTFSLEEMAFLWLCIENEKSVVFAGGTASGKTTSLNAVSLFIPSRSKIVSIEDTREVELPQRNWIASVTRPSFSDDGKGDIDEFDLLEAALRQRPEYIVMGEIRGEEGRTLFQVMSTGHTTLTTFHADSVGEVIKRFTTDPINVSKTMFTALDLVSIQTQTRVEGDKVRRIKSITEVNHYDPENDEINVQDVYQWQAETDTVMQMGQQSNTLDAIAFNRGWRRDRLQSELFAREIILAYLIKEGLNTYTQVAATLQAFMNDQETIMTLIANEELERSLEDLREMESVEIDINPDKEAMVPRPDPSDELREQCRGILEEAEPVLAEYRGSETGIDITDALDVGAAEDIDVAESFGDGGSGTAITDEGGLDIDPDLAPDSAEQPGVADETPDIDDIRADDGDESDP